MWRYAWCLAAVLLCACTTTNLDKDNDGWCTGPLNSLRTLTLKSVNVHATENIIGKDDLYMIVDDVRFPQHADNDTGCRNLCGTFPVSQGDFLQPNITVAQRALPCAYKSKGGVVPIVTIRVMTDHDFTRPIPDPTGWFKLSADWSPVDDHLLDKFTIALDDLPDNRPRLVTVHQVQSGRASYELTFVQETDTPLADPDPDSDSDSDGDGLRDSQESALSLRFGGIADPTRRNIFLEFDTVSPSRTILSTTAPLLVSAFANHGIRMWIDSDGLLAGYQGGSETISPGTSTVFAFPPGVPNLFTFRDGDSTMQPHFAADRKGVFHYEVFVDDLQEPPAKRVFGDTPFLIGTVPPQTVGLSGIRTVLSFAGGPGLADVAWDYQVITVMHELGHDLGLCHPRRVAIEGCPYSINSVSPSLADGATAMGQPVVMSADDLIFVPMNSVLRPLDYLPEEWSALRLTNFQH